MKTRLKLIPSGERFGRLTVVGNGKYRSGRRTRWVLFCFCECGASKDVDRYNLISGKVLSCGCFNRENRKRLSANYQGANNPKWKGGRNKNRHGYVQIWAPDHPNANSGGYVQEHRLVVETALGRHLKGTENVHHFDEVKDNNAKGNLVVCPDLGYHQTLHRRTRAFNACGNPNWRKCPFCKQYDDPLNMKAGHNGQFHHIQCMRSYQAEYSKKRRKPCHTK